MYYYAVWLITDEQGNTAEVRGNWKMTFNDTTPCDLRGSSVVFGCTYAYPSDQTITNTFWKFWSQWWDNYLCLAKKYRGCAEYLGSRKKNCTLRMNNIISSDATPCYFRFEMVNGTKG
ncbi:unnamed protein product [Coregonus sp. 'balchen']|nr:unnamed protein product [Coregonus sp. 'balchen']